MSKYTQIRRKRSAGTELTAAVPTGLTDLTRWYSAGLQQFRTAIIAGMRAGHRLSGEISK